jgi:hypothetical protein
MCAEQNSENNTSIALRGAYLHIVLDIDYLAQDYVLYHMDGTASRSIQLSVTTATLRSI